MTRISEWVLTEQAHLDFAKFCSVERNKKMAVLGDMFVKDRHITFTRYFGETGKCKSHAQWKGRLLAVKVPLEAIHTVRTPSECGRLMALKYMSTIDTVPAADLKSKDYWISPETTEWLA